jgi:hypothetical protein
MTITPTESFSGVWLRILESMFLEVQHAMDGLPQEGVDWVPGPNTNSLAVLAVHVAGSARYLIGDVIAEEPSHRDRAAEFATQGLSADVLKQRLEESLAYVRGVLVKLTPADLETTRKFPRDGSLVTVAWCVGHTLEHTAMHAGHAQLTRQLWDQQQAK